jgi:UDPglucose--hexose-1-phosphate uridylyltransferase
MDHRLTQHNVGHTARQRWAPDAVAPSRIVIPYSFQPGSAFMTREFRFDPFTETSVHIVADRQNRPNLPSSGCPFCVGGLEAPEPYSVRTFPNRWPALEAGYCEVVLYSPQHDARLSTLSTENIAELVDVWAERTTALQALPNGECVVIFENNGAEIGATIPHPHGQIYAFDHAPQRVAAQLKNSWAPDAGPGDRLILERDGWRVWAEYAAVHPVTIRLAPIHRVADLPSLSPELRQSLAPVLHEVFSALDNLFDDLPPYMMWWNQAPRSHSEWPDAWLNMEIISPWRANGVPRYIAGVEVATGEYFNPVDPADVARRLRDAMSS